jgi:DNA/RNA-binding domain of Phe-tRNA-synthetase-like protein
MQLVVTDAFWTLFPAARIGVVTAHGLDNTVATESAAALLERETTARATALVGTEMATHPAVAPWRAAYARFGAKPSKYRSSIESLLRSAPAGRLRSISPLVDLYNAVSLRHALPCGGEDLAAIVGDVQLTRAVGGGAVSDDRRAGGRSGVAGRGALPRRCRGDLPLLELARGRSHQADQGDA